MDKSNSTMKYHSKPRKKNARQRCLESFQKLRRLEESDSNGYVRCISCGKVMHWTEAQGGHYISRKCRGTEIDRDNVFPQCPNCNGFLKGNLIQYRYRLSRLIGEERVKRLELIYMAEKGSDEAREQLSDEDKAKINSWKSDSYYIEMRKIFDTRIKDIKKWR